MILKPPDTLPAAAVAVLEEVDRDTLRLNGQRAVIAYLAFLIGVVLVVIFVPVRDTWQLALIFAALGANLAMSRFVVDVRGPLELAASFLLVLVFSRACSPFILTPIHAIGDDAVVGGRVAVDPRAAAGARAVGRGRGDGAVRDRVGAHRAGDVVLGR